MTKLRARVNELERDLLCGVAAVLLEQRFAKRCHALLRADDAALEHDVVLLDEAVVRPAAHGVD